MLSLELKFKIYCIKCGTELSGNNSTDVFQFPTIEVEPCGICLSKKYDDGYNDRYDDGGN